MNRRALSILIAGALSLAAGSASAASWQIGDNDGYGVGIPDGAPHSFDGFAAGHDGRSAAEAAATNGAQYTDTYSVTHGPFSPPDQTGSIATFTFSGLGSGWTVGYLEFDMADFQATTFGAVRTTFNGVLQDWAFNDGFPNTRIRTFNLETAVLDAINSTGELVVVIDRLSTTDFYGFDYARLWDKPLPTPEPGSLALLGLGLAGLGMARRRRG